jgi:hypothetical protein
MIDSLNSSVADLPEIRFAMLNGREVVSFVTTIPLSYVARALGESWRQRNLAGIRCPSLIAWQILPV